MRVHWFSPLPPDRTDISDFTSRIVPSLSRMTDLTLWTCSERIPDLEVNCPIRHFDPQSPDWPELNQGVPVYNLGNNPLFHEQIWRISRIHSGIVVLHDYRLSDFFLGVYRADRESYFQQIKKYHGASAVANARSFFHGKLPSSFMAIYYPLVELALENALGVVVHCEENYRELVNFGRWPVIKINLPFPISGDPIQRVYPKTVYRLILFGYIGGNRCLESILEAISEREIRPFFHLDVYGTLWDPAYAKTLVRKLDLQLQVTIHGFVSEQRLNAGLRKADLAINLRNPTMGEASGSQLRIWSHGLPSIVSNTGWYSTLPQDTVALVRSGYEKSDLSEHLRRFSKQPELYNTLGLNGLKALKKYHDPVHYTKQLVEFLGEIESFYGDRVAGVLADRSASRLGEWLKPDSWIDRKSLEGISDAILHLSGR